MTAKEILEEIERLKQSHYKEMDILNLMETVIVLKNLKNAIYAMGGLSVCRDNESVAGEQYEALDRAIEIVNKAIPQKVKRDPFGAECPHCGGRVILPSTYTFGGKMIGIRCDNCYSCGQALDWSVE